MVRLDVALTCAHAVFGDSAFKKWLGDKYERRMNRAVFDCITRFFADEDVARIAEQRKDDVVAAFKQQCTDPKFMESIERTTKSIASTQYRIQAWGSTLSVVVGKQFDAGMAIIR
ncbi:hypothetical protein [Pandoraea norimbergensis]|uniref:Uncharacterized protein n=1 Tax=Pandoraea norimbergensis TaxID=93219 RepID=A0ABM5WGF9_9BURK|nr:hypothetical protein [Pandoraea norimbergensis]ALS59372.1 hypothetical protein AT302_05985 [Pandoraea norimbergensis]